MAETAAPVRKRTPAKKSAPATAEPVTEATAEASEAEESTAVRTVVSYTEHAEGPTKNFGRFNPDAESGCRGTFYAPVVEGYRIVEVRTLIISEPV